MQTVGYEARKSENLLEDCKIRLVGFRPKMDDNFRLRSNLLGLIPDFDSSQNFGGFRVLLVMVVEYVRASSSQNQKCYILGNNRKIKH